MQKSLLAFILLLITSTVFGYTVDVQELNKSKKIRFNNWQGRYSQIVPAWQIRRIGTGLATSSIAAGVNKPVAYGKKFLLIRAYSEQEPDKLAADIFSIDRRATVLSINYVREVITGYLMRMYGYTYNDAATLALFVTYYNAVYRGDVKYFSTAYKKVVMQHINKNNAGIALNYYQWPGNTRLVIPLTKDAKRGKLDAVDPDIISDKRVKDKVRTDEKNIKKRQDLVDIKKRIVKRDKEEIKTKKEELKSKKDQLKKDEVKIADKKKEIKKQKEETGKKEKDIKKEKDEVKTIKDPEKRKKQEEDIKKKEDKIKEDKDKIKKEERDVKKKEEKLKKDKDEIKKEEKDVKKKEEKIEKKEKDIDKDKKEIRDDVIKRDIKKDPVNASKKLQEKDDDLKKKEKDLDKREDKLKDTLKDKKIYANKFYYLEIKDYLEGGHYKNELYMIDAIARKVMFKSPVKSISGKRYDVFSEGIVVITRPDGDALKHVLTLVDRNDLTEKVSGSENVFWRSFVEIREGFIYAIVIKDGDYYLGKFGTDLKLVLMSKAKIHKDTFITFYENFIYINSHDKKILILKSDDFSQVDVVKP